jgi:hypothetical protein
MDTLLMFNDTEKYANLYKPDYRYDEKHLNDKGAKAFTRASAREFTEHLETVGASI